MKLTNKLGLPAAFVRAVERDPYNNQGTLSVTTLIRPPQMVQLEKKHWDEIEDDVSDRVWTILGQAGHTALERTSVDGDIVEERLFMDVDGVKISGQLDRLTKDGVLVDWKFTSVWSVIDCKKNGAKKEWEQQLNMLAELVRYQEIISLKSSFIRRFPVPKALRIIAVCRDWRPSEANQNPDYPNKVEVLEVPLWDSAMAFIKERVHLHTSDSIPCTDEERWVQPGKFAILEEGKKKALRLLSTKEEAREWCAVNLLIDKFGAMKKGFSVQERPTTYTRCERYCSVSKFCPQIKQ